MPSDNDEAPALSLQYIALAQPSVSTAPAREFARPSGRGRRRCGRLGLLVGGGFGHCRGALLGSKGGRKRPSGHLQASFA